MGENVFKKHDMGPNVYIYTHTAAAARGEQIAPWTVPDPLESN